MTVSIDSFNWISSEAVEIKYSSDLANPVYTIFVDGVMFDRTPAESIVIPVNAGDSPVISIVDDGIAPKKYPKRATLTWWSLAGASKYRIEEYIDSEWISRDELPETGKGYYLWTSRVLEDSVTHSFRVIPVDEKGNDGTAVEFDILMVRIPDKPSVDFSYNSGTRVLTLENT